MTTSEGKTNSVASRIVGIDLAASAASTAFAVLADGRLEAVQVDVDDDRLVDACVHAEKIGIDCPLGWPSAFVAFVTAHSTGRPLPVSATTTDRAELVYRETDRWVAEHFRPLRPLSVSADRIAHAALRCAGILQRLGESDRSGLGRVVEVYPAASLIAWGLSPRRYKGPGGRALREILVNELSLVVDLGANGSLCRESDHALDAVVAALSATAAQCGAATLPGAEQLATARREGWIAVPTCTLTDPRIGRPSGSSSGRRGRR